MQEMTEKETEELYNLLFDELATLLGDFVDGSTIAETAACVGVTLENAGYRK